MPESSEIIPFLKSLRAVRQFRSEPIPEAVVDDLLQVARWSGSAKNRQPWEFHRHPGTGDVASVGAIESPTPVTSRGRRSASSS